MKRNANAFYAVMGNLDTLKAAYETAESSAGSAEKEQLNYAQSIEYSLSRLSAVWQEFAHDFMDSKLLKAGVELLYTIVEGLDNVTKATHGLVPALTAVGGAIYVFGSITGLLTKFSAAMKALTAAKAKDTVVNEANRQSQKRLNDEKERGNVINFEQARSQKAETDAQQRDILTDAEQEMSDSGKGGGGKLTTIATTLKSIPPIAYGVVAAIAAIGATIYTAYQRSKELKESAYELGTAYKNTKQELSESKKEIESLHEKINDSSTSYDDAKEARKRLLAIQDSLIEKFGDEKTKIDMVTDAINGQVDALDKLSEKEWIETKNKYNKKPEEKPSNLWGLLPGIGDAINFGIRNAKNKKNSGDQGYISTPMDYLLDNLYNADVKVRGYSKKDDEFLKRAQQILGGDYEEYNPSRDKIGGLQFSKDLAEAQEQLYQLQKMAKDFDVSSTIKSDIDKLISNNLDTLKEQTLGEQWILNEEIAPKYKKQLDQINQAYDDYSESKIARDSETSKKLAEQAKNTYIEALDSLKSSDISERALNYIKGLYPEWSKEIGSWEFGIAITRAELDEDQIASDIEQFSNEEELVNLDADHASNAQAEAYGRLSAMAAQYKMDLRDLISLYRELKGLDFARGDNNRIASNIQSARGGLYGEGVMDLSIGKIDRSNLDKALNQLTEDEYDVVSHMGTEQWDKIAEKANDVAKTQDTLAVSSTQYLGIIRQVVNEWLKMNEAANAPFDYFAQFDGTQIGDRIKTMESQLKTEKITAAQYFEDLQNELENFDASSFTNSVEEASAAAQTFYVDGISRLSDGFNDLIKDFNSGKLGVTDYVEGFRSMSSTLSSFTDSLQKNSESWYKEGEAISSGTNAALDSAQEKIQAGIETIDQYKDSIAALEDITSGAVTIDSDDYTAAINTVADDLLHIVDVGGAMSSEIKNTLGTTTEEIAQNLTGSVSNQGLACQAIAENTNSAIGNMADAVGTLFQTIGEEISNFQADISFDISGSKAVNLFSGALGGQLNKMLSLTLPDKISIKGSGKSLGAIGAAIKTFGQTVSENIKGNKIDLNDFFKTSGDSKPKSHTDRYNPKKDKDKKGGGGGGGKDKEEEETDILAELSKQLDEIQAAYKSLNEIVEAYNANGKLTVDQAQALINTDFRYLALLTDQNGQLKLNEQGFQDLAKAKIQEMQIQLARNAIDTINSFEDEAKAVDYLTYAYEGLKGAALDATEAQLQAAVAAAKARGAAQGSAKLGEAAERVYEGYLATKKAIGNTDFSKESLSGDTKDKDKEKTDKDKSSKKEKDTKTRFNWLEKLVNKIQRSIDKLANRIDKYFTYQQKNALVDKQISANRKMINTQEVAVDYYQKQASKALKKVPKKYRKLVSGDFDAASVKKMYADVGEKGTKKLQTYLDWQSLLEGAQDALEAAYDSERELITSKLDNILTYFDTLIGYQQNIVSNLEASAKVNEAKGQKTDINNLLAQYSKQKEIVDTSEEREKAYQDEASKTADAIRDSYNSQIGEVETEYQDTTTYQKLKGKKGKKAKAALNDQYQVLAEDVDAFVEANKIYEKYKNSKKSSKQAKANEAKATMDRLHKKYVDYIDQLKTEEEEALKAAEEQLADQQKQNETATLDAEAERWNKIHDIIGLLTEDYDKQIQQLNTMVEKYSTIADLVGTISAEALKSYGVEDIFGSTDRAKALSEAYSGTRETVGQYKEQYNVFERLIAASQRGSEAIAAEVERMLNNQNLSEESKKIVQDLANDLRSNDWNVDNTWIEGWQESLNEAQNGIADAIKSSEDYLGQLLDGILEASRKEVEKLSLIADKFGTVADLLNEYDASILEKYGVGDIYGGTKNQALTDAMNASKDQIAAEKRQFDLYDKLISAFSSETTDNDRLNQLADLINDDNVDEESKHYIQKIADNIQAGVPVGTSEDLAKWQKEQQQNLSNISGEIKKSQGYLQQISSNLIEASEKNINSYTAIIDRFGTIADLLGEVNSSVLKGYGVAGIFGGYDKYTDLALEVKNSKLKVAEQKETYTLYSQLASAFLFGEETLFARLSKIYNDPNLSAEQKDTVKELLNNYKDLNTEEQRKKWEEERDRLLKDISSTIKTAEAALDTIFNGITESSKKEVEQLKTLSEKFSTIADLLSSTNETVLKNYGITNMFKGGKTSYISSAISSTKDEIAAEEKQYSLYTKLITALTSSDKVGNLWKVMNSSQLSSEMRDIIHSIIIAMANGASVDIDKYVKQFKEEQNQSLSELSSSISKVESLHRQLLATITETNDKMIESYESMQAVFSAKASIINEDWLTDVNGITEYGYAKAATLAQELSTAQKEIDARYNNVRDIERNKNQYISALGEDEYNKAYNEAVQAYYEEIAGAQQLQNQIYELSQKAMTAEIDRISKLVDNYKKALNAKKSYYDYDKTLREKNKNIESLESQIAALTNVTDAASKARMKSLQAELEEAQEDLKDTVYEHSISVENDALDDLLTTLNESIDNSTKTISEVIKDFTSSVESLIETADGYNTDWSYSKLVDIATGANALSNSYGDVIRKGGSAGGSVKADMANGKYSAVSAANVTDKYSAQVLDILTNTNKMLEFQSGIKSATNYMPAISNSLNSIRDNVGTITKNTSRITGQLDQMQASVNTISNLVAKQGNGVDISQIYKQLQKIGNVRTYR